MKGVFGMFTALAWPKGYEEFLVNSPNILERPVDPIDVQHAREAIFELRHRFEHDQPLRPAYIKLCRLMEKHGCERLLIASKINPLEHLRWADLFAQELEDEET